MVQATWLLFAGIGAAWAEGPTVQVVPTPCALVLIDGQRIVGVCVRLEGGPSEEGEGYLVRIGDAPEPIQIPMSLIASSTFGEGSDLPLPEDREARAAGALEASNAVSYFYAPSAFMLGRGRGYLSQKEIAITTAAFGVTNFLDIQVGTIIPTLFIEDSQVAVLGAKAGGRITDTFRLGGGTQVFFAEGEQIGFLFGNATLGTADRNLTLGGGVATSFDFANQEYAPVLVAAGTYRLGQRASLLTENWLVLPPPGEGSFIESIFLPSGGVRLFASNFAVDLGIVLFHEDVEFFVPIPWVSFTWNWEVKRWGG